MRGASDEPGGQWVSGARQTCSMVCFVQISGHLKWASTVLRKGSRPPPPPAGTHWVWPTFISEERGGEVGEREEGVQPSTLFTLGTGS